MDIVLYNPLLSVILGGVNYATASTVHQIYVGLAARGNRLFQLSLEPLQVTPPGMTKRTIYILAIRSDAKLADIQKLGRVLPERVLLPAVEEEEAPEDLFPEQTLVEAEAVNEEEAPLSEPVDEKTPDDVTEDDVADINAVFRICRHFWQMQLIEVCGQLGYRNVMDMLGVPGTTLGSLFSHQESKANQEGIRS